MLDAFLDWLARLPTLPTYGVLMLLSALENVFPPVPADVAVALGAFLAQRGEASAALLGLACWFANTASAAATYAVGRAYGERVLTTAWGRTLVPPEALAALREASSRHGIAGIFVSRLLPGIRAAVPPFAGVAGMSPVRALVPAATASALWYAFLIAVGSMAGLGWPKIRRVVDDASAGLGLLGMAAAVALVVWLYRRAAAARRRG